MIKTTGAQFKAFYSDENFWPEGAYYEYETVVVDGKVNGEDISIDYEDIADEAVVKVIGGAVFSEDGSDIATFKKFFNDWLKKQESEIILVQVSKAELENLKSYLKTIKAKIL